MCKQTKTSNKQRHQTNKDIEQTKTSSPAILLPGKIASRPAPSDVQANKDIKQRHQTKTSNKQRHQTNRDIKQTKTSSPAILLPGKIASRPAPSKNIHVGFD